MLFSDLFHLPLIFFLVRGTLSASVVTHSIAKNFTTPIKSNHEIELRIPVSKIKPQDSNEKVRQFLLSLCYFIVIEICVQY